MFWNSGVSDCSIINVLLTSLAFRFAMTNIRFVGHHVASRRVYSRLDDYWATLTRLNEIPNSIVTAMGMSRQRRGFASLNWSPHNLMNIS